MKYFTFLAFGCGLLPLHLTAQSLSFHRTYGNALYDDIRGLTATDDGCFVFTGLSESGPDLLGDMYLTKVNAAGAVLWTKYYGREKEDGGNSILATADGGFLMSGHTALAYGSECDGYLVKTDAQGNEQWRSLIGTAFDDVCQSSVQLTDGFFYTTGRVENPLSRTFEVMLAKISPTGEQVFLTTLPSALPALGLQIVRAQDDNLLIAGYTYRPGQQNSEMLVLKCTPAGTVLWQTTWGTEINDRAYAIQPLTDGSIVAVGGSSDATDRLVNMLALRLDAQGNILAARTDLAGTENGYLYDMKITPDGQLAVAGVVSAGLEAKAVPCMAWMDPDLNVSSWCRADFAQSCRTRCLVQDRAGNFVLGGHVQAREANGFFLAKMTGNAANAAVRDAELEPLLLFPNPFRTFTYLKVGDPFQTKILTITAMDGKKIRSTRFEEAEIFIYRENMLPGTYLFTVQDGQGGLMTAGKLVVQ